MSAAFLTGFFRVGDLADADFEVAEADLDCVFFFAVFFFDWRVDVDFELTLVFFFVFFVPELADFARAAVGPVALVAAAFFFVVFFLLVFLDVDLRVTFFFDETAPFDR